MVHLDQFKPTDPTDPEFDRWGDGGFVTNAMARALEAVRRSNPNRPYLADTLHIGPGCYRMNGRISNVGWGTGLWVEGEGTARTVLEFGDQGEDLPPCVELQSPAGVGGNEGGDVGIERISLGSWEPRRDVLSVAHSQEATVRDVWLSGGRDSIVVNECRACRFWDMRPLKYMRHGLRIRGDHFTSNHWARIVGNRHNDSRSGYGLYFSGTGMVDAGGGFFELCSLYGAEGGVLVQNDVLRRMFFRFNGCCADGGTAPGFVFKNVQAINISGSWLSGMQVPLRLDGCKDVKVVDCEIGGALCGVELLNSCDGLLFSAIREGTAKDGFMFRLADRTTHRNVKTNYLSTGGAKFCNAPTRLLLAA